MRDLALELELRGNAACFLPFAVGQRSDVDRSNCTSPPFCRCCWNRIAAARARSWITESSNLSFFVDRIRVHGLLEPPPPPPPVAAESCDMRFEALVFIALRENQRPIAIVVCKRERLSGDLRQFFR